MKNVSQFWIPPVKEILMGHTTSYCHHGMSRLVHILSYVAWVVVENYYSIHSILKISIFHYTLSPSRYSLFIFGIKFLYSLVSLKIFTYIFLFFLLQSTIASKISYHSKKWSNFNGMKAILYFFFIKEKCSSQNGKPEKYIKKPNKRRKQT